MSNSQTITSLSIGLPKETREGETRVALTPEGILKLCKKVSQKVPSGQSKPALKLLVERTCGVKAGFPDSEYQALNNPSCIVELTDSTAAWGADVVLKFHRPTLDEIKFLKKDALLICFTEANSAGGKEYLTKLAAAGVNTLSMELIPRTSRAQSMDALSSQANIAGYRAVIEAAAQYGRFVPLMMTSAGSAKAAQVMVLGAGVAGLQAIATAKRLGARVEAYDVRAEVKEQIQSLGAKFVELDVGEEGSGQGGYAKELSEEAKKKQQQALTNRLKKCDIIISTANIPGRKAPVLITEEAVQGMRAGSVIIDMAAANGGNCPLTVADQTVQRHGVSLVGITNYPAMMPADSSSFYGQNLIALLELVVENQSDQLQLRLNLEDDIIAAALVTHQGDVRGGK